MTGLKAHVVHLYPGWVLSGGNGTFAMVFIIFSEDFKILNITLFRALSGQIQIQHMAAQKVRFMPRLLRQVAVIGGFQAQLH